MSDQIISREGHNKLRQELDNLINVKRKEIARRIEDAKELGDLSENAEYHDAKEAQAFNDGRISDITAMLKTVTIVESEGGGNEISMGSKFLVESASGQKEFEIVSFNEVDPGAGKISNESPLGMAFLRKKKGDKIKASTPKGEAEYEILKIN